MNHLDHKQIGFHGERRGGTVIDLVWLISIKQNLVSVWQGIGPCMITIITRFEVYLFACMPSSILYVQVFKGFIAE